MIGRIGRFLAGLRRRYRLGRGLERVADAARAGPAPRESEHLVSLLERLGLRAGHIVDIGASDAVGISPTLPLLRDPAWRGLAVECKPARFGRLAFALRDFPQIALARVRVTPANVVALLHGHGVPERFAVLKLDIDSYDLFVLEALLASPYRPGVIVLEVNENIPPPLYFSVLFSEDHAWTGDHFQGCSIVAACAVARPAGYRLEHLDYNNAHFVREDLAGSLVRDLSPAEAYRAGYVDRQDRRARFPWNADMDDLREMAPERAVEALRARFRRYEGKFVLELRG